MKGLNIVFFSLLFSALLFSGCATQKVMTMTDMDKASQRYVSQKPNKGLVVGYILNDEKHVKGFGIKGNDDLTVPDGNSIFEIGALTEIFTATLMHRFSAEGKLDPADCVNQYLKKGKEVPDYHPLKCTDVEVNPKVPDEVRFLYPRRVTSCTADFLDTKCVTFCNLSSHSSGLRFSGLESYRWHPSGLLPDWDASSDVKSDRFMKKMNHHAVISTMPGKYFRYSSAGQAVLGSTLEIIAEKPFADLLDEYILTPLQLQNTNFERPEDMLQGHNEAGRPTNASEFDAYKPAGGLVSNADDLLDFLKLQMNPAGDFEGPVERTHDVQVESYFRKDGKPVAVTNGWFVSPLGKENNEIFYWKNGGTKGFNAFVGFNKTEKVAVVVLSNSVHSVDEIGFDLIEVLSRKVPK